MKHDMLTPIILLNSSRGFYTTEPRLYQLTRTNLTSHLILRATLAELQNIQPKI